MTADAPRPRPRPAPRRRGRPKVTRALALLLAGLALVVGLLVGLALSDKGDGPMTVETTTIPVVTVTPGR